MAAVPLALPVFLVKLLGLPAWAPGATLALNAILVAVSAPFVMSAIAGRRRRHVLIVSQACMIVAFAVFLLVRLLPAGALSVHEPGGDPRPRRSRENDPGPSARCDRGTPVAGASLNVLPMARIVRTPATGNAPAQSRRPR